MAASFLPDLGRFEVAKASTPKAKASPSPLNGLTDNLSQNLKGMRYGSRKLELELKLTPKNPIIIEGFPGLGFVATIVTEYLMDHLKMRSIGKLWSPRLAPMALVHGRKVVQPIEIFYNAKFNIIVLEAVAGVTGMEWEVADAVLELYKKTKAKEIIGIEGIGSQVMRKDPGAFYYTTQKEKVIGLEKAGLRAISEGAIFGVSGALMIKEPINVKASFIFAETHSDLPDSRAAAKIIQVLDQYLKLDIDYKPLLKRAAEFEEKLKGLIEQTKDAASIKNDKDPAIPYFG
jgi:predicted ATP-grasp superfamily ATP-dependent carboligase